jgi:hypothetical protein
MLNIFPLAHNHNNYVCSGQLWSIKAMHKINCPCQYTFYKSGSDAIKEFKDLREKCSALKTILISDLIEWDCWHAKVAQERSGDRSILLAHLGF